MKSFLPRKEPLLPVTNPIVHRRRDSESSSFVQLVKIYGVCFAIFVVVVVFTVSITMSSSPFGRSIEPEITPDKVVTPKLTDDELCKRLTIGDTKFRDAKGTLSLEVSELLPYLKLTCDTGLKLSTSSGRLPATSAQIGTCKVSPKGLTASWEILSNPQCIENAEFCEATTTAMLNESHGSFSFTSGHALNSEATLKCDTGYELVGANADGTNVVSTCVSDVDGLTGIWSKQTATCKQQTQEPTGVIPESTTEDTKSLAASLSSDTHVASDVVSNQRSPEPTGVIPESPTE
eukprot:451045_1